MSVVIYDIEQGIINIVKEVASKNNVRSTRIYSGTPQTFITKEDNEVPCILVSCTQVDPVYQSMYIGTLTFSIYYISFPKDRITIYKLMEDVVDKLQGSTLDDLNGALRWLGDKFFYEDANYLIFVQQWTCDKLK